MTAVGRPAPPFDRELLPLLESGVVPPTVDLARMVATRAPTDTAVLDRQLAARGLVREDRTIPGLGSDPEVTVGIVRSPGRAAGGPGIYFAHGGGMVVGDRWSGADRWLDWAQELDAVVVTVEYRRAPEHPDPHPHHDTCAGLIWTLEHAGELGFDADLLVAAGLSAGAGLVAGAVLEFRDAGGPVPAAQVLLSPMLDDRNATLSATQVDGIGVWDRASNAAGWGALLGDRHGTSAVSSYAAPARATDLSGLPPTFLDVGSAEVFRDETVAYAHGIWAAGGAAELHVWAGGCHGFDGLVPTAAVSVAARAARLDFLRRLPLL